MVNNEPVRDATVEQLIEQWNNADLTLAEGEVQHTDFDQIEVRYQGIDGELIVTYTLAEELTYRTDGDVSERFNIIDYDNDQ
jgi:hypothetical protein